MGQRVLGIKSEGLKRGVDGQIQDLLDGGAITDLPGIFVKLGESFANRKVHERLAGVSLDKAPGKRMDPLGGAPGEVKLARVSLSCAHGPQAIDKMESRFGSPGRRCVGSGRGMQGGSGELGPAFRGKTAGVAADKDGPSTAHDGRRHHGRAAYRGGGGSVRTAHSISSNKTKTRQAMSLGSSASTVASASMR